MCSSLISRRALHVLELPHPLLADDVDGDGVIGRAALLEEDGGAPGEHDHGEAEGDDAPQDLEGQAAVHRVGQLLFGAAAVADGEIEDREEDHQREEHRDREQEIQQVVHIGSEGGRLIRK